MNFEIIESRKSAVTKGKHFILQLKNLEREATKEEVIEALKIAYEYAEDNCFEKGRYRIAMSGAGERHRGNFHIHIILPKDDDELIRIVEKLK